MIPDDFIKLRHDPSPGLPARMSSFFRSAFTCIMCVSLTSLPAVPPPSGGQQAAVPAAAGEMLTASSIPGLPGFVRSPYTNPPKLVDVGGAAPGSVVVCPYTERQFIVPSDVNSPKGPVEPGAQKPVAGQVAKAKPQPDALPKPAKDAAVVLPVADSAWRVTIGPQWRQIGTVDWQTGSAAASWSLPWLAGTGKNVSGSNIPRGIGDHTYDDGFVNQDPGTSIFGNTWFWGYNNASQIQGSDLVLHAAGAGSSTFSRSSSSSVRHSSWSDDLQGAGIFAKVESPELLRLGCVGVSLEFAYSWAQDDSSKTTRDVFQAVQTTRSITQTGTLEDRYDISGLTVIPGAPYAGTFTGPGPSIPNAPYARSFVGGSQESSVQNAIFSSDVRESFDINLHTLSFGPHFSAQCCKDVRLGLGLGLALNIADWDAQYQETLSVSQNGGKAHVIKKWQVDESGTEVLPGFYIEATCEVRLSERLSAYVAGRYDWSDSIQEQVGPSRVSFEPGGWSVMLGLTVTL